MLIFPLDKSRWKHSEQMGNGPTPEELLTVRFEVGIHHHLLQFRCDATHTG